MSDDKILVQFVKPSMPYNAGEVAGFERSRAIDLVRRGFVVLVAEDGEEIVSDLPDAPAVEIPEDFDKLNKGPLEVLAEALGLEVEGSGNEGAVVKADLVAAIAAKRDELANALSEEE